MTQDERALMEEKFKGVIALIQANGDVQNIKFEKIFDKLDSIETQTTKTNGRVTKLEDKVFELEKRDLTHINNCPQTVKIEKINEELLEYKMIKKYPKFFMIGIAGVVILFLIELYLKFQ